MVTSLIIEAVPDLYYTSDQSKKEKLQSIQVHKRRGFHGGVVTVGPFDTIHRSVK